MIKKRFIPIFLMSLMKGYKVIAQTNVYNIPIPTKQQLAWQQEEFGVVLHYDLHVFDTSKYNQTVNRMTPIADYNIFNSQQLNEK
ncbi:MAG: hypothetical protein ABIN89_07195 [Chitinophagaceae bacterium]